MLLGDGPDSVLVCAPRAEALVAIGNLLARHPDLARRIAVAPPRVIRRALIEGRAAALTRRAIRAVLDVDPNLSALSTTEPWQLALLSLAMIGWFAAAFDLFAPAIAFWSVLFLAIGVLRAHVADVVAAPPPPTPIADADLPSFAVLVPLHHEAKVVPRLVEALLRLDYPADRLDRRLVVEADDLDTRAAVETAIRETPIDVVLVPPSRPRTKPKALNFALATVDAAIVTVYDAEDRPDPDQLRLAAAAFAAGPPDLAVVQAALEIDHTEADRSWLVRQFEIEYAMLFHGLLPWLAARDLFLPLGGTSNHFRRAVFDRIGGWDPHNVTEDADIAVRLARAGCRIGMIPSRTREEAPKTLAVWSPQRVRWLKGWMQTWLVHMRRPGPLHRELGLVGALALHLTLAGQLASAFVFAPSLLIILLRFVGLLPLFGDRDFFGDLMLVSSLVSFALGLAGAVVLAQRVTAMTGRRPRLLDLATMPAYWCLISFSAYRALFELLWAPHRWNKTSHGHVGRASDGEPSLPDEDAFGVPVDAAAIPAATAAAAHGPSVAIAGASSMPPTAAPATSVAPPATPVTSVPSTAESAPSHRRWYWPLAHRPPARLWMSRSERA